MGGNGGNKTVGAVAGPEAGHVGKLGAAGAAGAAGADTVDWRVAVGTDKMGTEPSSAFASAFPMDCCDASSLALK
jgi:hypothetical protein